jgi:hypothetical protein
VPEPIMGCNREGDDFNRPPAQLPLGDALEPGPLDVVAPLRTPRGVGRSGGRELEDLPPYPDHPSVLADLDPEVHGLPLGASGPTIGKSRPWRYPSRRCRRANNAHLGEGRGSDKPKECSTTSPTS